MVNDALYISVADHLCDKIIKGEIQEGDVLDHMVMAEELAVSRNVVKEALVFLVEKSLFIQQDSTYSLMEQARSRAIQYRRNKVLTADLLSSFALLSSLSITEQELLDAYQKFLTSRS